MNAAIWLPLAVVAYGIFAINGVIDKVVVSKKIKNPLMVSFWVSLTGTASGVILLAGLLPAPYGQAFWFHLPALPIVALITVGGVFLQVGLLLSYAALKRGEATRVQSAIGAAVPVFALVFAFLILGERLSPVSYLAFVVLMAGAVTMLFRRGKWLGLAFVLAISAAAFMAMQTVIAKIAYQHSQFISALVLFGLGNVVYCLILLVISPKVREGFHQALFPKRRRTVKRVARSGGALILVNSALGSLGVIALNLAIKFGSVSLVNALKGLQYAGVFLITLALSRFVPRLLKEELTGQTMRQKVLAILIIGVGLGLLTVLAR